MSGTVALVTDFGLADSYVAEVHRAIVARVPGIRVLDVAHEVPAYGKVHAALLVERTLARIGPGDAVMAVVDPGVGSARRRIAVEIDGRFVVGPDNGVIPPGRAWEITRFSPVRGVTTFDGREVFGPVAARLAAGLDPALLGPVVECEVPWVIPADAGFEAGSDGSYAHGVVITCDRYGNAITNLRLPTGASPGAIEVIAPEAFRGNLRASYAEVDAGAALALVGSSGRVELCRREAPSALAAGTGVVLRWR